MARHTKQLLKAFLAGAGHTFRLRFEGRHVYSVTKSTDAIAHDWAMTGRDLNRAIRRSAQQLGAYPNPATTNRGKKTPRGKATPRHAITTTGA